MGVRYFTLIYTCLSVMILCNGEQTETPTTFTAKDDIQTEGASPANIAQIIHGITFTTSTNFYLVFMDMSTTVYLNFSMNCSVADNYYRLNVTLSEENVVKFATETLFLDKSSCDAGVGHVTGQFNVTLTGILPGRTFLVIRVHPLQSLQDGPMSYSLQPLPQSPMINMSFWEDNVTDSTGVRFPIICLKEPTQLDSILQVVMMVYLLLLMTAMGCKTELVVLKVVFKKPIAPIIGLACQFLLMPLIAFAITRLIEFPSVGMALGFFACGCCPGGGGSNLWAYLLGGDVSLSAAMTTISNFAAIGTFPLWIFTLGRVVLADQSTLTIPYMNIVISVLMVAVPLAVGAVMNYKKPLLVQKILRYFIPFLVVLTIAFIALTLYANLYMFRLIKPILLLAGALLPYIGYICGLGLALIFRQDWVFCKTIAVETGIQNVSIAFIMVMFSFEPPDNVLAGTAPIASSTMTPIPLLIVAAIYHIYLKCCAKKNKGPPVTVAIENNEGTPKEKEAMLERMSSL